MCPGVAGGTGEPSDVEQPASFHPIANTRNA